MSIKLTPSSNVPSPLTQVHTKDTINSIKGLVLSGSACIFGRCDICLPALADLVSDNVYKNDFYTFILSTSTNSIVTGTLIKTNSDGTETSIVIVDNTYGDFYPLGTLRSDVWGFKLKWKNVATLLGFGRYRFNITIENPFLRTVFNEDTPCFDLMPWSCENEHPTTRIEVAQKGYIEDGFDFRGLTFPPSLTEISWQQQIRVYGELKRTGRTTETDGVEDNQRRDLQIQTRNFKNWDLRLDWMEGITSNFIIDEMCLASPIKVSSFNQFAVEDYRDVELKYLSSDDPEKITGDKHEFYIIKFEDYKKGTIKRHG